MLLVERCHTGLVRWKCGPTWKEKGALALAQMGVVAVCLVSLGQLGRAGALQAGVLLLSLILLNAGLLAAHQRFVALKESSRRLQLLAEMNVHVNRDILLNGDIEFIYRTILNYLFSVFDRATTGSVLILGDDGYLTFAASKGFTEEFVDNFRLKLEDSFLYQATSGDIREALLLDSEDFQRIETVLDPGEWEYRSVISAPLFVEDRLFGVLNLDSPVSGTYNAQDVSIVEQFRTQIEIGLLARERYTTMAELLSVVRAQAAQLAAAFEAQQQLNVELQRLDAYRIRMIATISHELRSPLTAVTGHLELMSSLPDLPPEGVHSTAVMQRGAERLSALANSLLELTRLDQDEEPPRQELVDLDAVLAETVELLKVVAAGDCVCIDLKPAPGPVHVLGDAGELHRALANLVGNAIKYSNAGDTVVVGVKRVDDEVVLSCADQGLGISAADQTRLFTEFFRSTNQEALDRPGTGLGLAIVQRIVERHRGRVEMTSELGVGTTFEVHLPAGAPA